MNPSPSTNLRHDESRSTRHEDDRLIMRLRNEEEKVRRRREWKRQQELERQHEELKRQMISDYEKKRAETIKGKLPSSHHSRSKSSSKSPSYHRHRERSTSRAATKSDTIYKKLDRSTSRAAPLFTGPEGTQFSTTELRRIKVDIHRNIPATGPVTTELQREIVNPEDVILKRREDIIVDQSFTQIGHEAVSDKKEKQIRNATKRIKQVQINVAILLLTILKVIRFRSQVGRTFHNFTEQK